jgi:hypothetical protein
MGCIDQHGLVAIDRFTICGDNFSAVKQVGRQALVRKQTQEASDLIGRERASSDYPGMENRVTHAKRDSHLFDGHRLFNDQQRVDDMGKIASSFASYRLPSIP